MESFRGLIGKRKHTCSEMILPALKGGASVIVRARNTGLKDEKGKRTYNLN